MRLRELKKKPKEKREDLSERGMLDNGEEAQTLIDEMGDGGGILVKESKKQTRESATGTNKG